MKYRIADLFCGAGGTSAGAVEAAEALGRKPEVTAVNHWPVAIATHTANHPGSRHLCTGIDSVNPRELFGEGELDLLWASPECTHHSVARGGKPINDQSRATAWCVVRWAEALRPPIILIENVPEFETWGPIGVNGRPLASKKGQTFQAWLGALQSLGYKTDHRLLCAADYGDPTTRTRLFVQAVRGRRKIVWPEKTHSKAVDLFTTRRWTPAREIIDWSLPAGSIFERKKPLSPKTLARIEAGLRKYGLKSVIISAGGPECPARPVDDPMGTVLTRDHRALVEPYIVAWDHTSGGAEAGLSGIEDPLSTVVTKARHGVAEPFLVELRGTNEKQLEGSARSLDAPCGTVTTSGAHHALVEPFLIKTANGASGSDASRVKSVDEPMPTVCGNRGDVALIEPYLLGQQTCSALRPISDPAPTVSTAGAIALVEPFLVSFYGNGQPHNIDDPAPTVTCKDRFGLVRPVVEIDGNRYLLDIRFRMLQPHELALAQGFPKGYQFTGTKTDQVKQIGNAVPRRLARAIVGAVLSQNPDVSALVDAEEMRNDIERGAA
jgi:DNA (cytosine-5)-methyltransferase 1